MRGSSAVSSRSVGRYTHKFIVSALEEDKDYQKMTVDEKRSRAKRLYETGAWWRTLYSGYLKDLASTE